MIGYVVALLLAAGCPEVTARLAAPMIVDACTSTATTATGPRATTQTRTVTAGDAAHPVEVDARGDDCNGKACDDKNRTCVRLTVVIWALETGWSPTQRAAWALRPSSRHACGPMQVVPVRGLTPSCKAMQDSATGFAAGVTMLRAKWRRVTRLDDAPQLPERLDRRAGERLRALLRAYNGHPKYRDGYARRGMKLWTLLQETAAQ